MGGWSDHIVPSKMALGQILVLFVTWPYHRTLRYYTLDPAEKLYDDWRSRAPELWKTVNHWRESKDHEYDFVCAASTLAAIVDISVFSWTDIGDIYWLAAAFFYSSLSLSLWAVILAAQQKSVTRTLVVNEDISARLLKLKLRIILRIPDQQDSVEKGEEEVEDRRTRRRTFAELNMLYVWQCPLMLMSYGWATMVLGLTLYVCSPLIAHASRDRRKVAIYYLVTAGFLFLNFVWASAWSYWRPQMSEEEEHAGFRNSMVEFRLPFTPFTPTPARHSNVGVSMPASPMGTTYPGTTYPGGLGFTAPFSPKRTSHLGFTLPDRLPASMPASPTETQHSTFNPTTPSSRTVTMEVADGARAGAEEKEKEKLGLKLKLEGV